MMAMAVVGGGSLLSPTPPADNEVLTSFFHALLMYFAVLFALLTFGVIILLAIKSKDSPISVILHQCLADALTEPQVRAALEESISNSLFGTGSRAFRPVKGAIRFAGSGISKAGRSTGNGLKGLHGKMRTIIRNASGEKESEVEVNPLTESELLAEEEGSDRTSIKKRSVEDGLASLRGKVKNLLRKTSDKSRDTKREEATNDSEAEPSPERED